MAHVRVAPLDPPTASCLRAGPRVRDVAHAAVELVRNAIDAGATAVRVRVHAGALRLDVTDDGGGIAPADLAALAVQHHTAAAASAPHHGDRYGVRGEALASLAQVARVCIESRTAAAPSVVVRKTLRFGAVLDAAVLDAAAAVPAAGLGAHGTRVSVSDLFGALPVRQRRLVASAHAEVDKVKTALQLLALAHPAVAVTLEDAAAAAATATTVLHVARDLSLLDRFRALYGAALAAGVRHVQLAADAVAVHGLLGRRGTCARSHQVVFVNGRLVRPAHSPLHRLVNRLFASSTLARVSVHDEDADADVDVDAADADAADAHGPPPFGLLLRPPRQPHARAVYRKKTTADRFGVFVLHVRCPPHAVDLAVDAACVVPEFHDWAPPLALVRQLLTDFLRDENLLANEAPARPSLAELVRDDAPLPPEPQLSWADDHDHDDHDDHPFVAHIASFSQSCSSSASSPPTPSPERKRPLSSSPPPPPPPRSDRNVAVKRAFLAHLDSHRPPAPSSVYDRYLAARSAPPPPQPPPASTDVLRLARLLHSHPTHHQQDDDDDDDNDNDDHRPPTAASSSGSDDDDEPTEAVRSSAVRVTAAPPHEAPRNVQELLSEWINPVFPRTEDSVPRLATGSHHRYAKYYRLGQTGLDSVLHKADLQRTRLLGQIDHKFIACHLDLNSNGDLLLLIDQHAADERIRLERLTHEFLASLETLVAVAPPGGVQIHLEPHESHLVQLYLEQFARWGIHMVVHHTHAPSPPLVFVRRLPTLVAEKADRAPGLLVNLIKDYLAVLDESHGTTMAMPRMITHLLNSHACRGAIKFGDPLLASECQTLLDQLSRCDFPFQCAHGRPSMIPLAVAGLSLDHDAGQKEPPLAPHRLQRILSNCCTFD